MLARSGLGVSCIQAREEEIVWYIGGSCQDWMLVSDRINLFWRGLLVT